MVNNEKELQKLQNAMNQAIIDNDFYRQGRLAQEISDLQYDLMEINHNLQYQLW